MIMKQWSSIRAEHFCPILIFPSPGAYHGRRALLKEGLACSHCKGNKLAFRTRKGIGMVISPRQARLKQQKIKYKTYIHITLPLTSVGAVLAEIAGSAAG